MKKTELTWLVCGENCMPINVLRRHGQNAPSTPYSAGRSSIEQFQYFEANQYADFLSTDFLTKVKAFSGNTYVNTAKRNSVYFRPGQHFYLELTHHDPLESQEDREALQRRIKRMLQARKDNKIYSFVYHHRSTNGFKTETRSIIKNHILDVFSRHKSSTTALCYSQQLVRSKEERGLEFIQCANKKITFCTLKTLSPWSGNNLDLFFGRVDDDLLSKMLNFHKDLTQKREFER